MSENLIFTLSCPDRPGIVHAVTGVLAQAGGNILESRQFNDQESGLFFMRIEAHVPGGEAAVNGKFTALAEELDATLRITSSDHKDRTVIMVTKDGHCLTDLLAKQREGTLPIDVVAVVGNHPDLKPIAEFYGAEFIHIPITAATRAAAESQLLQIIEDNGVELVILARYMQILSPELCRALEGNVINIHHSFLPSFKGARPYAQAHQRGVKLIGATAHYVTADLDEGPIIEQDVARVAHDDDVDELMSRGADVERLVLSRAVRWHAERRVLLDGDRTVVFA